MKSGLVFAARENANARAPQVESSTFTLKIRNHVDVVQGQLYHTDPVLLSLWYVK